MRRGDGRVSFGGNLRGLQDFHAYFAPVSVASSGGTWWTIPQGLLAIREAAQRGKPVGDGWSVASGCFQRFLTEAGWDDDAVIGRLQEYLGPRLEDPEAVVGAGRSDFPSRAGSRQACRQYCGALGKISTARAGLFLAQWTEGTGLGDKRFPAEEWTGDVNGARRGCRRCDGGTGAKRTWLW